MQPILLETHRIGDDGPWWTDCRMVRYDGSPGKIIHSTAPVYPTRNEARQAAATWLRWRHKTTVIV